MVGPKGLPVGIGVVGHTGCLRTQHNLKVVTTSVSMHSIGDAAVSPRLAVEPYAPDCLGLEHLRARTKGKGPIGSMRISADRDREMVTLASVLAYFHCVPAKVIHILCVEIRRTIGMGGAQQLYYSVGRSYAYSTVILAMVQVSLSNVGMSLVRPHARTLRSNPPLSVRGFVVTHNKVSMVMGKVASKAVMCSPQDVTFTNLAQVGFIREVVAPSV